MSDFLADLKIERAVSADLRAQVKRLTRELRRTKRQCDELLAALENIAGAYDDDTEACRIATAAIAKAEGHNCKCGAAVSVEGWHTPECEAEGR